MNGKTFISLFSGCGGSSLGYKLAGYKELLAIDNDKNSVETFKLNFDSPVWQRDIREVTSQEILDFCNIQKGELDLLDGSPPCQGFSTSGKRQVTDNRNSLAYEFMRLIKELQPKVFVMENVSGMIKGTMKGLFVEITKEMKKLNYNVKVKMLNAKYYNVPQTRERIFWIGIRKDLNIEPSFPEPNLKTISIKDVLKKDGYIEYRNNYSKGKVNLTKSSFDKPCLTITKTMSWNVYPEMFNKDELKLLSSFPKDFNFTGTFEQQWARIGNAVMPNQMKAIAEHISKIL